MIDDFRTLHRDCTCVSGGYAPDEIYNGECAICDEPFGFGVPILMDEGKLCVHMSCAEESYAPMDEGSRLRVAYLQAINPPPSKRRTGVTALYSLAVVPNAMDQVRDRSDTWLREHDGHVGQIVMIRNAPNVADIPLAVRRYRCETCDTDMEIEVRA